MQVMMYATPAYVTGAGEMSPDMAQLLRWASWVLTLPVVLFSCQPFWANAWRDLRLRRVSMDLPVALGMAITFVVSTAATFEPEGPWGAEVYFDSLTMFVFFLLSSRWLEGRLRERTAGALEALMNRLPDSVERLEPDGQWERVAVHRLRPGDRVRVLPGESFPADGVVLMGQTLAQEALLTGESRPLARGPGETVLAGSLNVSAVVEMQVQAVGESTRYAQIVSLMDHASLVKPRLAMLADRMARPFLLAVLLAAVAAAAWWWADSPAHALMVAVSVLIVTCPCALSLATPAAMFDKTATLTYGRPLLTATMPAPGTDAHDVLALVASLEQYSRHPLASAILAGAASQALPLHEATHVSERPGQGLTGEVAGRTVRVTSRKALVATHPEAGPLLPPSHGGLECVVLVDDAYAATLQFRDEPRTEGRLFVQHLGHRHGFTRALLVSGDRESEVRYLADVVGIAHVHASQSPEEKVAIVRDETAKAPTLFVGDGINDAPALATATVGIAFGQASEVITEAAGAVILDSMLERVDELLHIGRRMRRIALQSAVGGMALSAIGMAAAAAGWLSPVAGALTQEAIDVVAVVNALRAALPPRTLRDF